MEAVGFFDCTQWDYYVIAIIYSPLTLKKLISEAALDGSSDTIWCHEAKQSCHLSDVSSNIASRPRRKYSFDNDPSNLCYSNVCLAAPYLCPVNSLHDDARCNSYWLCLLRLMDGMHTPNAAQTVDPCYTIEAMQPLSDWALTPALRSLQKQYEVWWNLPQIRLRAHTCMVNVFKYASPCTISKHACLDSPS